MERLEQEAEKFPDRARLIKKAKVVELIKDASGKVIGVVYESDGKQAKEYGPVIIATGG
jgi:succinate dehydrogenase/fumarate reductase flavoprotein subunit